MVSRQLFQFYLKCQSETTVTFQMIQIQQQPQEKQRFIGIDGFPGRKKNQIYESNASALPVNALAWQPWTKLRGVQWRAKGPAAMNTGNTQVSPDQITYSHSYRMHKGSWPSVQLHCPVFC